MWRGFISPGSVVYSVVMAAGRHSAWRLALRCPSDVRYRPFFIRDVLSKVTLDVSFRAVHFQRIVFIHEQVFFKLSARWKSSVFIFEGAVASCMVFIHCLRV